MAVNKQQQKILRDTFFTTQSRAVQWAENKMSKGWPKLKTRKTKGGLFRVVKNRPNKSETK